MGELEKRHKEEVKKLVEIEIELSELIQNTKNLDLMKVFNQWQDQRNVCNSTYNEWLVKQFKIPTINK